MKVNEQHHTMAKDLFQNNKKTATVRAALMEAGLTKAQANSACKTARKQLKIWEGVKKKRKNAKRQEAVAK
jgi:hypothetical protein